MMIRKLNSIAGMTLYVIRRSTEMDSLRRNQAEIVLHLPLCHVLGYI